MLFAPAASGQQASTKALSVPLQRYAWVDALRGWAILAVIAHHVGQMVPDLPVYLRLPAFAGAMGVKLFFMVSAFTLATTWQQRAHRESRPVADFFVRRVFRIAPMFWAALLVFMAVAQIVPRYWHAEPVPAWHVGATAVMAHGFLPNGINAVVPGGWSIAAEAVFYSLLPFVMLYWFRMRHLVTLLGATAVAGLVLEWLVFELGAPASFRAFWFPTQAPAFVTGLIVALLTSRPIAMVVGRERVVSLGLAVSGILLLAVACVLRRHTVGYTLQVILFCLPLGIVVLSQAIRAIWLVVNTVTVRIGVLSYSIYFAHFIVVIVLYEVLPKRDLLPPSLMFAALMLVVTGAATAIASVTYSYVEAPGIALGKRLVAWLEASGGAGAATSHRLSFR